MIDTDTVATYDAGAGEYADDWETQPEPTDLYQLLTRHFNSGLTLDVGCGSGRDTAWLAARGLPCVGVDASTGLLEEATRRHPEITFEHATLPRLAELDDSRDRILTGPFVNILCETVIMHLPSHEISSAVRRLRALLRPGGCLYLSWRVTPDADLRDSKGRLYAAFDATVVTQELIGMELVHEEEVTSISSGRIVHRVVARAPL